MNAPGRVGRMPYARPEDDTFLRFVDQYQHEWGYPPSVRDIAERFEVAINTAHIQLSRLIGEGLLTRRLNIPRTLQLTDAGRERIS